MRFIFVDTLPPYWDLHSARGRLLKFQGITVQPKICDLASTLYACSSGVRFDYTCYMALGRNETDAQDWLTDGAVADYQCTTGYAVLMANFVCITSTRLAYAPEMENCSDVMMAAVAKGGNVCPRLTTARHAATIRARGVAGRIEPELMPTTICATEWVSSITVPTLNDVSQWGALPSVTIANSVVINSPDYGVLITNSTSDIVFTNLTSKTNGQGMHLAGAVAGTILVTKSNLSFNYYEGIWILLAAGTLNRNLSLNIDSTSFVSNGILGFGGAIDYSRDREQQRNFEFDQCYSCSVQVINSILKGNGGGIKSPTARQMNVVVDRSRFDANLGYAINLYASQTNSRITNSIFVNSAQVENSFYGLQFEFLIGLTPLQDDPDQRFIVTMTNNVVYRNNFTTTVGLFTNGTSGSQNNILLSNNYFLENQGQDVIFQNDSWMSITRNYFNNPLAQCDITMRASIPNVADNRFWTSSNANLATTIRPILSNDFKDANALGAQLQTLPVMPNQSSNSASLMRTCRAPSNQTRLHGLGDTTSFKFSLNI
ncbi:unnamed protein product, partial [Mesorhabditis belari]|uniref:Uncharacterized protein n=1 Tax=Mesorhabditis belari TaxID=2138241 RepID=A0AAF3F836_9BILA